jgi:large subunit ribosomal protein L4
MEVAIKGSKSKLTLSDAAFDRPFSEALVHQVVTAYLAGGRSGTKATKNRSAVNGGGRKPWRQKGTGQARAGTIRSPLWRGGGHTFALTPRDFGQKVNKKQYRAGIQSIFSELIRQGRLEVVKEIKVSEPKTRQLVEVLKDYDAKRILIISDEMGPNLYLSSRNVPGVTVVDTHAIDPVTLVDSDKVIVTVDAMKKIEEWLA